MEGVGFRARCSSVAAHEESPSTWPAVVMVVVAAIGPWADTLEARGVCWRCVCMLPGGMLQLRAGLSQVVIFHGLCRCL